MNAADIIGYTFQAANYCPRCIGNIVAADQRYSGWALCGGVQMNAEDDLDEIASAFSIDRMDERSYDSSAFPKVIFANQYEEGDYCDECHASLIDD